MYLVLQGLHLIPSLPRYLMPCLAIFHLVQLAWLLLFSYFILLPSFYSCFFLAISFLTVLALFSFLFFTFFLSFYCFLFFSHIIFFLYLCRFLFLYFTFLLFLNCFFFLALSCCICAASSFVNVPVEALATEEYPTVKSAIAQIGNSLFFIFILSLYFIHINSHRMYY